MAEQTNPAQRLLEIFTTARTQGYPFLNGWAMTFNLLIPATRDLLPPDVEIQVVEHLVQVSRLIDEVEKKILEIEGDDAADYVSPFPRFRACLRLNNVNSRLIDSMTQITDSDITVLRFCSKLLSRHYSEPCLDEGLTEINKEIEELYTQIAGSDLPEELKSLLLDLTHALRSAVHEYRIRGAKRLREGIEEILGKLVVNRDVAETAVATEEGGRFSRIFWKTVTLTKYAPQVWKGIETVTPVMKLLISPEPTDKDVLPPY
jgi:hypothetical protein